MMMMTKTRVAIILVLQLLIAQSVFAQFTVQGRIEYERKTNLHKLWDGIDWLERWKDKVKPFTTNYFNLAFTEAASRYSPGRDGDVPKMTWGLPPGADNDIVQDYTKGRVTAAKNIYEEHFLVQDSAAKLQWKIGSEVRTIAGYTCRKAVTRICDSVYVVAFYTDDIPVSGGPEQMGGLPGMILELAVPRLYTTWTALKVDVVSIKPEELKLVTKGKPITKAALEVKLAEGLKDWGKTARRNIWWAML
jgi:GLPGLI family protein